MKKMCIATLCIAVLLSRHAASAQENGSFKSGELARTGQDCNQQNPELCQPGAQGQPTGKQAEVAAADSQAQPDSSGGLQSPEKEPGELGPTFRSVPAISTIGSCS
jgi:hypothetical protein